jgi:membrane protease YdiL (CAAX protease family)
MGDTILSTVLQLLVFTLIPFIVYLITERRAKGFRTYIGLKRSNRRANGLAVLASLIFLVPPVLLTFWNEGFRGIMTDPNSISGHFRELGFSLSTLAMILITAIVKTALAEEILFRGFLAKRLIAWLGYAAGNIVQALIFGVLHLGLFVLISDNWFFLIFIFLFSGLGAYVSVYLNEKVAEGSIIPGWISHALANLVSYSVVAFMV